MSEFKLYFGKQIPIELANLYFVLDNVDQCHEGFSKVFESNQLSIFVENKRFRLCCSDTITKVILVDKKTQQSFYIYYVDRQQTSLNMLLNDIDETDMFDHILVVARNGKYVSNQLNQISLLGDHTLYSYQQRFSFAQIGYTDGGQLMSMNANCFNFF